MENAFYWINKKDRYVTIYDSGVQYPLDMWNEFKTQNDLTDQQVADKLHQLYMKGEKT